MFGTRYQTASVSMQGNAWRTIYKKICIVQLEGNTRWKAIHGEGNTRRQKTGRFPEPSQGKVGRIRRSPGMGAPKSASDDKGQAPENPLSVDCVTCSMCIMYTYVYRNE